MEYNQTLIPARFVKRENRFSATVVLNGKKEYVHVPNSGRLRELLIPNREVFLKKAPEGSVTRKTKYTLVLSRFGSGYVSIEAAKANRLFEEALINGSIIEFMGYKVNAREKRLGMSRLDFVLESPAGEKVYTEVKSVTLVKDGVAYFPDAPTSRGVKHVKELIEQKKKGSPTAVVFIIQRNDAYNFSPNDKEDQDFGNVIREAFQQGIQLLAYRCKINTKVNYVTDPIPVVL